MTLIAESWTELETWNLTQLTGNDVQMPPQKYDSNQKHGGAVTNTQKCYFQKAMHLTPYIRLI